MTRSIFALPSASISQGMPRSRSRRRKDSKSSPALLPRANADRCGRGPELLQADGRPGPHVRLVLQVSFDEGRHRQLRIGANLAQGGGRVYANAVAPFAAKGMDQRWHTGAGAGAGVAKRDG